MTWLKRLMKALSRGIADLSPNCKEAVRLQSDALDQPLPFRKRIGLGIHLLLCKWCRRYGRQILLLRTACKRCSDHEHLPPQTLSAEARQRIKDKLRGGKSE